MLEGAGSVVSMVKAVAPLLVRVSPVVKMAQVCDGQKGREALRKVRNLRCGGKRLRRLVLNFRCGLSNYPYHGAVASVNGNKKDEIDTARARPPDAPGLGAWSQPSL